MKSEFEEIVKEDFEQFRKIADRFKKVIALASNIQVYVIKRPKNGMTVCEQAELVKSVLI